MCSEQRPVQLNSGALDANVFGLTVYEYNFTGRLHVLSAWGRLSGDPHRVRLLCSRCNHLPGDSVHVNVSSIMTEHAISEGEGRL